MSIKKLSVLMGYVFLSIYFFKCYTLEINKTAGNIPSNMISGIPNEQDASTDVSPSSPSTPFNPPMTETTTTGSVGYFMFRSWTCNGISSSRWKQGMFNR